MPLSNCMSKYKLMMMPVVLTHTDKEMPNKKKPTISSRNNFTCRNVNGMSDDYLNVSDFTAPLYLSIYICLDFLLTCLILLNFKLYLKWEKVQWYMFCILFMFTLCSSHGVATHSERELRVVSGLYTLSYTCLNKRDKQYIVSITVIVKRYKDGKERRQTDVMLLI